MPDCFHADFATALLSSDNSGIERYLASPAALRRMAVYRNNVVRGAIEALRAAYPAIDRLVGPDFFSPMAKAYWQVFPPREPSMSLYGADFADFIAGYAPAAKLLYLADIARLDRAWLEAHHAADMPALSPASIAAMPPQDLPQVAPGLHPSVTLWRSDWPVYEIWHSNRDGAEPVRVVLVPQTSFAIVWRHRGTVRHRSLTAGEHGFLTALARGETLEQAAGEAAVLEPDFDPAALFGEALTNSILGHSTFGHSTLEGRVS